MNAPLVRALGRWSLAALVLNGVIGSSVFGLPSVIAGRLGAASPWAWVVAAIGIGVVMACFAELASRFGEAGGPYLYARVAFGRFAGIQMGWLTYLVRLTAAATNANLFVIYLGEFWPAAAGRLAGAGVLLALLGPLALVNCRGVGQGARLSAALIVAKLLPLALFVAVGLTVLGSPPAGPPLPVVAGPREWLDVILLLVFAYGGFEAALIPLGEARNPQADAPFALALCLGTTALIYSTVQAVVIAALPAPAAAARPLAAAGGVLLGPGGAVLMALAALISVYGYLAGAMVNVPRLSYAMAVERDLPPLLGRVHPRFHTPHVSVLVFATLVWLLAASGSFLQNLTLSAVSRLFTYGVVCAALIACRRREERPDARPVPPASFRLPAGKIWAILGIAGTSLLATRMARQELLVLAATALLATLNWTWATRQAR